MTHNDRRRLVSCTLIRWPLACSALIRRILVISLLAAILLSSGSAVASSLLQTVEQPRAVGAAGFTSVNVGDVTLRATFSQPLVGVSRSGNVELGHGFWHGVGSTIYLPVVLRN